MPGELIKQLYRSAPVVRLVMALPVKHNRLATVPRVLLTSSPTALTTAPTKESSKMQILTCAWRRVPTATAAFNPRHAGGRFACFTQVETPFVHRTSLPEGPMPRLDTKHSTAPGPIVSRTDKFNDDTRLDTVLTTAWPRQFTTVPANGPSWVRQVPKSDVKVFPSVTMFVRELPTSETRFVQAVGKVGLHSVESVVFKQLNIWEPVFVVNKQPGTLTT